MQRHPADRRPLTSQARSSQDRMTQCGESLSYSGSTGPVCVYIHQLLSGLLLHHVANLGVDSHVLTNYAHTKTLKQPATAHTFPSLPTQVA